MAGAAMAPLCSLQDIRAAAPPGSAEFAHYLRQVYGDADLSEALQHFTWDRAEIIWKQHLPRRLQQECSWPVGPTGRGSVFQPTQHRTSSQRHFHPSQALLVYRYDQLCPRSAVFHGYGGVRRPPYVEEGRSIEVTHMYAHDVKEKHQFFMYRAVGSGLFYRANRTLVCSDARDLAEMLNVSAQNTAQSKKYGNGGWVTIALQSATQHLLAERGIDTVMLTHHVDANEFNYSVVGHECLDFLKAEVIHIGPTVHFSCPRSRQMAWGWNGRRTPCSCVPNARRDQAYFVEREFWPFASIQCDVNAVNASKYRTTRVINVTAAGHNPYRGANLGLHTSGDEVQGAWLAECAHACHKPFKNPTCDACVSMLPER